MFDSQHITLEPTRLPAGNRVRPAGPYLRVPCAVQATVPACFHGTPGSKFRISRILGGRGIGWIRICLDSL